MTKNFDAVAWMRKRRSEIDREDHDLTWMERSRKTIELLSRDPLWNRFKDRTLQRTPSGISSRAAG